MPWGYAAAAVGSIVAGKMSADGAKDAAGAQTQASMAAVDEQRRQFDLTRQDQLPWLQAGQNSLATQQALLSGDYSKFYQSPEYQWTQQQGLQGIDRSAAARGSLYSGGADADRMKFAQGLASQEYGNFWNRLAGVSGTGQTSATNLGSLGQQSASNIGNALIGAGNARASAYQSQADTNAQTIGALGGMFNNWYQGNKANNGGGTGWYLGNNPGRG